VHEFFQGARWSIAPEPAPGSATDSLDSTWEITRFLELAVPALADYQRRRNGPRAAATAPDLPEAMAEDQFWIDFLDERDEILRLKWIESEKAGWDIGFEQAIQKWLKHRTGWRTAHAAAAR